MELSAPQSLVSGRLGRGRVARLAGVSGLLMVAAIVVNGPLAAVFERYPSFWTSSAGADLQAFLRDTERVDRAVVVFALSNLIFIFSIPATSSISTLR